jgi:hypothetical protein
MKSAEETKKHNMERLKANNPDVILREQGTKLWKEGDYEGSFEYNTKAAESGDAGAHYNISNMYAEELGVEKNKKKEIFHLEEAAIGGHDLARYSLGLHEYNNRSVDRAMKHFIIAANLGCDETLKEVKKGYAHGAVSKEDFEAALRGHQAAVDATKSEQREEAYAYAASPGLLGN